MAFEVQYKDDIQERMKEEYKKVSDKTVIEGGFARDAINEHDGRGRFHRYVMG